ncbi:MAG TPA: hypothetical protein VLC95_19450 [Anaerolineae bacterium]|nr:hypothetical protein [Anaerolineae bacterium]
MNAIQILKSLGPIDARNVRRDPLLKWMAAVPLVVALAMRWVLPVIFRQLSAFLDVDLSPYTGPLVSYLLVTLTPSLVGLVIGFLLLDERDDRTLTALQVTPLTLNGYLAYRLLLPGLLSIAVTVVVFPLAGLHDLAFLELCLVALSAAPLAPLFALFLAAFAANKVQGFALQKGMGIVLLPPMIAYFLPMPWQLAAGLVPTFWPAKVYWVLEAGEPAAWAYALAGLLVQSALLALLVRRFNRVMTS